MAAHRSTAGAAGGGEALPSTQWSLKRYARFLASGGAPNSWEVFESSPEKGFLSLIIVQSGHFLISQGGTTLLMLEMVFQQATVNLEEQPIDSPRERIFATFCHIHEKEGFSLIEAHKWWKAVRRADCVLFGSKVKNESRMFRVQFSGESHEQAMEHCSNCMQKLLLYIHVQNPEGNDVNRALLLSQPASNQSESLELEAQDTEKGQSKMQSILSEHRMSIKQVAKSMLGDKSLNLPLAYQHSALNTEELGPFLKLCLMDQSFPAFVEQVEWELKKLIEE